MRRQSPCLAVVVATVLMPFFAVPSAAAFVPPCQHGRPSPSSSTSLSAVSWAGLALDYETRVEPVTSSFIEEMVDPFDVSNINDESDGESHRPTLLDVGCGTGQGAIVAAKAGYSVTAIDNSPAMTGRLLERCGSLDGINIECQVVDGQSLPAEWSNTYDFALSAFALIFFPNPLAGMKEMQRCLIPGGRAVISGWGDRGDSPAFRIIPEAVRSVAPELVASGSKDKPFLSSADDVAELMRKAGFIGIVIKEDIERTLTIASSEAYYRRFALGSPPTLQMMDWMRENMGEAVVQRFKEAVMTLAVERGGGSPDGPINIVSPAYLVYGTKPVK